MKFSSFASGLLALGASLASAAEVVKRASLQQVANFGSNPSGVKMYLYVPNKLATNPAIIVAIHYCSGTAQAFYQGTQYAQLAEKYGYIVSAGLLVCLTFSSRTSLTEAAADRLSTPNLPTKALAGMSHHRPLLPTTV